MKASSPQEGEPGGGGESAERMLKLLCDRASTMLAYLEVVMSGAHKSPQSKAVWTRIFSINTHNTQHRKVPGSGNTIQILPNSGWRVHTFSFLGTVISANLLSSENTSAGIKKTQQLLHFLRAFRKTTSETFYRCTMETFLTSIITLWFSHHTEAERERLHRWSRQHSRDHLSGPSAPPMKDLSRDKHQTQQPSCSPPV